MKSILEPEAEIRSKDFRLKSPRFMVIYGFLFGSLSSGPNDPDPTQNTVYPGCIVDTHQLHEHADCLVSIHACVTGTLVVDTFGSSYDTVLTAYTFNSGNSHFAPVPNGCNGKR